MGIYLHFVRIMWQMKPCSFRLVIPFLLALSLSVSLFFHLGFHRKCPAEQTNKKIRSKTTHKNYRLYFFIPAAINVLLSKFLSFSSMLFCFCFLRFFFFLRKKTIKRITVLEKKRNF